MKVAVIGGVRSTEVLIRKLREHGFDRLHVWGYSPANPTLVSGWTDLATVAAELGLGYSSFVKVASCEDELRGFEPDLLFAVGLSQILPPSLLSIARQENIGFHPTALPRGRGRAPIAWIVLDSCPAAATFFGIRAGVDDGPVYVQCGFHVTEGDDAAAVETRLLEAEAEALDDWLPQVAAGELVSKDQDASAATWYGRRAPEDGWINWSQRSELVLNLVRASTRPHPGAWTLCGDTRVTIWKAESDSRLEKGVIGRILQVHADGGFTVQAGSGLVRITRWTADGQWTPRVGVMLGFYSELEIHRLREKCAELEQRLGEMEAIIQRLQSCVH